MFIFHPMAFVGSLISVRAKASVSDGSVRPNDLLALFKQTGPKTRTHIRSAEFLDNTVELIREMVYTHSMDKPDLTGTHTFASYGTLEVNAWSRRLISAYVVCILELLSAEDMETILQVTGCSTETQRPMCKSDCLSKRYRTITGHCNNRCTHTSYGLSLSSESIFFYQHFLTLQRKPFMGGSKHPVRPLALSRVWGPSRGPEGLEPTTHLP